MASNPGGRRERTTVEQLLELGGNLLVDFILQRIRRHTNNNDDGNDPARRVTRELLGGKELSEVEHKKIGQYLQMIGDELDGNAQLQNMINDPKISPSKDTFVRVAWEIFSDGKYNWGRVVALFYFACRLVIKALVTKLPEIINTIITWTIDFVRDNVIGWLMEQGGWEGIRSYFGTPTWQTVAIFLAGVLTAVVVLRKN